MSSQVSTQPRPPATPPRANGVATSPVDVPKPSRTKSWLVRLTVLVVIVGAAGLALKRSGIPLRKVGEFLLEQVPFLPHPHIEPARPPEIPPKRDWGNRVGVSPTEAEAIGLQVSTVKPQTKPILLELTGRTAYDVGNLIKIRPRFDTLVERVHASLGQRVKKGDPLVDLYSTELAEAKNAFQTKYVQWQHDLRLLKLKENLVKTQAISQQNWVDALNDENKSRLDYITARGKLRVLGVPDEEVEPLIRGLGDLETTVPSLDSVSDKAKMTLRSPADGIVIEREVVPGNLYDNTFVLMVIAPLDYLFVWANVYERDQAKVTVGQRIKIAFPFLDQQIEGTVQYVASEVSRDTRAIKIRASIPNLEGKFKADMFVRALLEIPPVTGQTVIPRLAMVVANGHEYVFVQRTDKEADGYRLFERRQITVAQEERDQVVVAKGLSANETVAVGGSLILAELYEDQVMSKSGAPVPEPSDVQAHFVPQRRHAFDRPASDRYDP